MSKSEKQPDIEEQIVQYLKQYLGLSFTLFQFSEMAGRELLELLNSCLHAVSEDQPESIGTEKIEATVERMSEFLRVLKYDFPCEPEEWDVRLGASEKELIYPVLLWLLSDFEHMKKQAYRAKFSEEVTIPEEIKVDPTVSELIGEHRELREKFDQVLEDYDQVGGTNVEELKKTMTNLESDKARLATKISKFQRKMSNVRNLDELLKWTSKLREESDKEMRLNDQLQRLNDDKRLLLHRQQTAAERVNNIKGHMEKRLAELRGELASLKSQSSSGSGDDKSLAFAQQQVVASAKRLDMKQKQLAELQQRRREVELQVQQKQEEGAIEIPSPSEFAKYVKKLKQMNENYKDYQNQLAGYKKELAVMMRTEEIVNKQKESVRAEVLKIEKQRGVGGFREAREQLEKVSATKADLDDMKGKTLEEMSRIVKEIQKNIQARQNELKPIVARLQDQRKKKAAVESKYLQAKQRYQNAVSEYQTVCMELDEECKKYRCDIATYQSKYHSIHGKLSELERSMKRAREEQNALETGNPVSRDIKSYSDFFQRSARAMKKETQALKEQKKSIGNESEANQKQLEMFQSLRRLLQVKLECLKIQQKEKAEQKIQEENEQNLQQEIIIV